MTFSGIFHHPLTQSIEIDPRGLGSHRHEAGLSHSRKRINLKESRAMAIQQEIHAAIARAAQCFISLARYVLATLGLECVKLSWAYILSGTQSVFVVIIIWRITLGNDLDNRVSSTIENSYRQFPSYNTLLHQGGAPHGKNLFNGRSPLFLFFNKVKANTRPLAGGLDHQW